MYLCLGLLCLLLYSAGMNRFLCLAHGSSPCPKPVAVKENSGLFYSSVSTLHLHVHVSVHGFVYRKVGLEVACFLYVLINEAFPVAHT